ncbi:MAG: YlbF family regulator [Lachnospiraceae bacterium]|nr:YlbF family regulator [Lachnospiraceae bacterium]
MDSIMTEATKHFIKEIRESDIYKEYDYQRTRIKKQPELFEKIQDYRQENFELQAGAQGDELFDKIVAFEQEYEKFRENPLVDDFLRAELAFCRMIQEVNVQIAEELEFE